MKNDVFRSSAKISPYTQPYMEDVCEVPGNAVHACVISAKPGEMRNCGTKSENHWKYWNFPVPACA